MVLTNARVVDGTGGTPLERASVRIEDGRIVEVATGGAAPGHAIELVRMVDGGLPALEGISAATRGSAKALGLTDAGTLTSGAVADLIAIDGDPTTDIRILLDPQRIWMVIQIRSTVADRSSARELSPA